MEPVSGDLRQVNKAYRGVGGPNSSNADVSLPCGRGCSRKLRRHKPSPTIAWSCSVPPSGRDRCKPTSTSAAIGRLDNDFLDLPAGNILSAGLDHDPCAPGCLSLLVSGATLAQSDGAVSTRLSCGLAYSLDINVLRRTNATNVAVNRC
jgi:hypothetical protein